MSLSSRLSKDFTSAIRARGAVYFNGRAVKLQEGGPLWVSARVRGMQTYKVELRREGARLLARCTCPYFESDLCKHIWATILAAEAAGYLRGLHDDEPRSVEFWDEYDDEFYEGELDGEDEVEARPAAGPRRPSEGVWRERVAALAANLRDRATTQLKVWPEGREILYIVDAAESVSESGLPVEILQRERKVNGEWKAPQRLSLKRAHIAQLPDAADRQILSLLAGAREAFYGAYDPFYYSSYENTSARYRLLTPLDQTIIPMMCASGRLCLRVAGGEALQPLAWDDGPAWAFWLEVRRAAGDACELAGTLRRGEQRMEVNRPALLSSGLVFEGDRVARLDDGGALAWLAWLREQGTVRVSAAQADDLLAELLRLPTLPRLDLPDELRFERTTGTPHPCLTVKPRKDNWGAARLSGVLSFEYGGARVDSKNGGPAVFDAARRRLIERDAEAERKAVERLRELGFRQSYGEEFDLAPSRLPRVVRELVAGGWTVEAEGKLYRRPGEFRVEVRSGIDWFELHGHVEFEGQTVRLPELLAALRRGDNMVRLGDGSFGLLPEEWLKKYAAVAGLGAVEDDHLRFSRGQVGLLDALLAAQPEASFDEQFARLRDELMSFDGLQPAAPPPGFVGELRGYQRDGLGWMLFLQRFGLGGCLADDMGLGKTVQVLALLESRRAARGKPRAGKKEARRPSLVVVPKSLIFNWKQEAARFAPRLRLLDHTGAARLKEVEPFNEYDVVLTTYGTLRRDIARLKDVEFDYAILDEAQAIKNAATASAKAARLLKARHRLALSGTPVENHLGELWSLFDFLNPGMLGAASVFKLAGAGQPDEATRKLLARALRPFILRRTKQQVARELPPKTEQTLYCELGDRQRRLYDELRDHYRRALLGLIDRQGIARSKMQILEALLRLRQAACHPALIEKSRGGSGCAKLEALLPQLAEVVEEGHKALVFSQFTGFLKLLREQLDEAGLAYEYLDGRTRDRAARVERFQNDEDCRLFLISLKAGGLGLNLTAAEYVFLLDPWWNPAVEAQAIDRAHRIGQACRVFAYRLIARDTIEEKVLALQETKRQLAEAIITADNSLVRSLTREDLELLLA